METFSISLFYIGEFCQFYHHPHRANQPKGSISKQKASQKYNELLYAGYACINNTNISFSKICEGRSQIFREISTFDAHIHTQTQKYIYV